MEKIEISASDAMKMLGIIKEYTRQALDLPHNPLAADALDLGLRLSAKLDTIGSSSSVFLYTITGPSLSGKTTLARLLVETGLFTELVSHTTRRPRAGEINGKDYYFVSHDEFNLTEFVECVEFNGSRYGLSSMEVKRVAALGKIPIVVVEPNGVRQIADFCLVNGWQHTAYFISNPIDVIAKRWLARAEKDSPANVFDHLRRLHAMITEEKKWIDQFFWDGIWDEFDPLNEETVVQQIVRDALERSGRSAALGSEAVRHHA